MREPLCRPKTPTPLPQPCLTRCRSPQNSARPSANPHVPASQATSALKPGPMNGKLFIRSSLKPSIDSFRTVLSPAQVSRTSDSLINEFCTTSEPGARPVLSPALEEVQCKQQSLRD